MPAYSIVIIINWTLRRRNHDNGRGCPSENSERYIHMLDVDVHGVFVFCVHLSKNNYFCISTAFLPSFLLQHVQVLSSESIFSSCHSSV